MQLHWRIYLLSALVSCVVAGVTTLVVVRLAAPRTGWATSTEARPAPAPAAQTTATTLPAAAAASQPAPGVQTLVQEGVARVHLAQRREEPYELDVFYKVPFASPPYLSFPDGLEDCEVADQKPASFKLRRYAAGGDTWATVKWKAEGQPAK